MSNTYRIDINIRGMVTETERERDAVWEAIHNLWEIEGFDVQEDGEVVTTGVDQITIGNNQTNVCDDIAKAIFTALGREVPVQIFATFLDPYPDDVHFYGPRQEAW